MQMRLQPLRLIISRTLFFAYKKKQWIDHFTKRNNQNRPDQGQIDEWISQLSEYDFWQMRNEAADFFHASAEEHLRDYIDTQKKAAVDPSILSEVRNFTSLWRHLGVALLMALLAPIILGGIVFFAGVFDSSFPIHITTTDGSGISR
jgi:hypothetical protein